VRTLDLLYVLALAILLGIVGPALDEELAVAQDTADAMKAAQREHDFNEAAKQACGTNAAWKLLRRHGYRMSWCPGPQGGFSPECALSATGHCPLVDRADAVVSALDLSNRTCGEVVRALDAQAAETPVVVVTPRRSAAHWAEEVPDCQVVAGPLSSKVLIRSLSVARHGGTPKRASAVATSA